MGDEPVDVSFMAERIKNPAFGLEEGYSGERGRVLLNNTEINPKDRYIIQPGDVLTCETPGGGGYGNTLEREEAAIIEDLKSDYISVENASLKYDFKK